MASKLDDIGIFRCHKVAYSIVIRLLRTLMRECAYVSETVGTIQRAMKFLLVRAV